VRERPVGAARDPIAAPEGINTPSERFEHFGRRLFAVPGERVRELLAKESAQREADNPGPNKKKGRPPKKPALP
jgi:hypothetical protein